MATTGLNDLRSVSEKLATGGSSTAVVNNTSISHAVELGAEQIDVLPTEDPAYRPARYAPRTALCAAIGGLRLLIHTRLEANIARHWLEVELTVMPARL